MVVVGGDGSSSYGSSCGSVGGVVGDDEWWSSALAKKDNLGKVILQNLVGQEKAYEKRYKMHVYQGRINQKEKEP